MSDHYDAANSPPDCYAHLRLTLVRSEHSFLTGSNVPALTPVISHLLPGQIAKPQITRRPPKLRNQLWVIRQVSHCGKPQRTASPKKAFGLFRFR